MSAGSQLSAPRLSQSDVVVQDPWPRQSRKATAVTVLTLVSLLGGIGLLLAARRLMGALMEELPRDTMLLTALVTTAVVTFARLAWRRAYPLRPGGAGELTWCDRLVGWGSSLGLALVAVGCCYPAYRNSDWLIWLPMLVADQFWRQSFFDAGSPLVKLAEEPESEVDESSTLRFPPPGATPSKPEQIVQQLYRVREDNGCEVIYGTLRADFHSGQRTAVLHVGFCPPLPYQPVVEAEALPGLDARLKIVQAMAHGARLDVRLSETPTEDCQVWIDMAGRPASV